ncbi:protein piccolo-like [Strongylocentrotus purpuratus]|uniref:Uncharacterized protein n=1 Tax=Strongylocentrotus purpuratus TaxID=7668 RepID=A0A7M7LU08_STRPU|nr:protein piccolo-like [Strongylocentrotus purpuratus]
MTSEQDNGNTIGKQDHHQKCPDEAALQQPRPEQQPDPGQQPGPAQLQVGPPEHAPPVGPYPNQGQAIADQPQGMMPPDFNQGSPAGPYPPQGYSGNNNQGYPQAIQTQPQTDSPGYNQENPQVIQTQPQSSSEKYDLEGPSVGVKLGDEDACISAEVECGEASKMICSGFTELILAGPKAGCNIVMGEESEVGCDLTLCGASCICGRCLCTLGLGFETVAPCSALWESIQGGCEEKPNVELMGLGITTDEGFVVNLFGSAIGYVDRDKRQERKDEKEEKRRQKEQAISQPEGQGVQTGVTNNGASVEDAI